MGFTTTIAKRFITSKKRNTFLSFISAVSLFGVALGVSALVVVMAVMEGFESELKSVITGTHSHVVVYSRQQIMRNQSQFVGHIKKQFPEVAAVSPIVYSEVMLAHNGLVVGSVIEGIHVENALATTRLGQQLMRGDLPSPVASDPDAVPMIALASVVAERLNAKVGDKINVISPFFDNDNLVPRTRAFLISGIISTGMYEYDSKYSIVLAEEAQSFFRLKENTATALKIKTKDIDTSQKFVEKLRLELGPAYFVQHWTDLNKNLLYAVKLQKIVIFIVLTSIIVVAAFNIVSTLMMMLEEKQRDMSILKALGMSPKQSAGIFISVGFIIGAAGVVAGAAIGLLLCKILATTKFIHLPPDIYYISYLPVEVRPLTLVIVAFSAMCVALFATLYPAREAALRSPVEGLRYE